MRILFVSHSASLTGAPISCLNLIERLPEGYSAVFATRESGPLIERIAARDIPSYVVTDKGPLGLGYIKTFTEIIRRERIDLVHLNTLTPFSKYAAIAATATGRPVVWFIRENPFISRSRRLRPWLRKLATRIVFVDLCTMNGLFDGHPPANAETVHNGVDLDAFSPAPSDYLHKRFEIPEGAPVVGYVGQITERKGVEHLVRAMPGILGPHPDARLVLVGGHTPEEGYLETVESSILELSLGSNVHLTGPLDDVRPALRGIDIVALPSLEERCSRALIEALAAAKPAVATNVGGNPEVVEHGHNGLLVEPSSPAALQEAITRLLDNPALRASMGRNGRLKAEREFDVVRNAKRIIKIYEEITRR